MRSRADRKDVLWLCIDFCGEFSFYALPPGTLGGGDPMYLVGGNGTVS